MKRYLCSVPAVLSGLPVGPLYPHIASFVQGLGPQGYSSCAINQKIRLLRRLDEWFVHRHIGIGSFDDALIERFLCLRRKGGHVQLGDPTTLRSFLNHLREHGVVPRSSAKPDNIQGHQLLTSFAQYLTEERGLARATLKRYLCDTKKFISERFRSSSISLRDLHPHDIARFVIGRGTVVSSSAAQHAVSPLRALLKFLQQRGDVTANLAASVPSVAKWSLAGLPKYLQSHEVERLLGTCKGSNAGERRDRAILLLLARLGLRGGEVAQLNLEDINWETGEVSVRGKGGRISRLPIPDEVGKALATYIRLSRPRCSCRRVFIRVRAPHQGLSGCTAIDHVVHAALKRAGLNPAFKGAHALRHSLATHMLHRGASLPEIGQILRHQLPSTTAIYAKADLAALRAIAQPWPWR